MFGYQKMMLGGVSVLGEEQYPLERKHMLIFVNEVDDGDLSLCNVPPKDS
jgi:hypothetical protein